MPICWRPATLPRPLRNRRLISSACSSATGSPTNADSAAPPIWVSTPTWVFCSTRPCKRPTTGTAAASASSTAALPWVGAQREPVSLQFCPGQYRLIRKSPPPGKTVLRMYARTSRSCIGGKKNAFEGFYSCQFLQSRRWHSRTREGARAYISYCTVTVTVAVLRPYWLVA